MFISRHSDPRTILLWGNSWWLPGRDASAAFGSLAEAPAALADALAAEPKPVRLRLLYQPDFLESVVAPCPQGNRATIGSALAGEFPALENPDIAWGYEPVLPREGGSTTVLHWEREPALLTLARELAIRGLAVDSAWPLAPFLAAVPLEWSESGAVTVVAVERERAFAYHHPGTGERGIRTWRGKQAAAEVGSWLRDLLTRNPEEPILVMVADDEVALGLETSIGEEMASRLEILALAETLRRPVVLPRHHPAQLLPRPPLMTGERWAMAAGLALLLTAAGAGAWQGWQTVRAREAVARQARELVALRAEVEHLRDNARAIASLRRELAGGAGGPPALALLKGIGGSIPPELALSRIQVDGHAIALEGWAAPGAGAAAEAWARKLSDCGPWRFTLQPGAGGAFRLAGEFQP